jgi:acyl-CoA synthetase (AMP-forming)/AMP-acid ligase II
MLTTPRPEGPMAATRLTTVTFNDLIVAALTRYPGRDAFVDGDRLVSYREAADRVGAIASILAARGVTSASSVLVLSPNRPESWLVQAATYLLGARFTGLQAMGSVDDHAYVCTDTAASMLFADPVFAERADQLCQRCPALRHVAFAVPTMVYALLDAAKPEDCDLSSLENITYGAAPMSPSRLEEAHQRIGPVFQQIYGQTETVEMGTTLRRDDTSTSWTAPRT